MKKTSKKNKIVQNAYAIVRKDKLFLASLATNRTDAWTCICNKNNRLFMKKNGFKSVKVVVTTEAF